MQLALPPTTASTLKRHAPTEFNDLDSENIDPCLYIAPNMKAKAFNLNLTPVVQSPKTAGLPQVVGRKRKAEESTITHDARIKRRAEPSSAPAAPAGRSPKPKRVGILSRRRATGSSYTRVNPPASSSAVPFSLNAALAGTVPMKTKSKSSSKAMHFDIYEDSPDDEMANLMEHSTCTLDISDDESRLSPKADRDNKENVPPVDYHIAANAPVTRRDMMTDEVRAPLGDLVAQDFYAEGCDANSVIIIPAEESQHDEEKRSVGNESSFPDPYVHTSNEGRKGWQSLLAQLCAKQNAEAVSDQAEEHEQSKDESAEIQIWESESAKAEDEGNEEPLAATHVVKQELLP